MTRCSLLRSRLLFVALCMVATVLSGCLQGAPDVQDALVTEQEAASLDPLQWIPAGPLRAALAPEPTPFLQAPTTPSEALRLWTPFDEVPFPLTDPVDPLHAALDDFARAMGAPTPDTSALDALGLTPTQEVALARTLLAFLEAQRIQLQATTDLSDDELAFLGGDPTALAAWQAQNDGADYDEAAAVLVDRIDVVKNLQAADLLSRAAAELQDAFGGGIAMPAAHYPDPVGSNIDADGDDVPDAVETVTGNEEGTPDEGGAVWGGDPEALGGVLLRVPGLGGVGPGLVIGGPGPSTITDDALLTIDLGGDDTYTARGFGGMDPVPIPGSTPSTPERDATVRNPLVKAVIDLGGSDHYLPTTTAFDQYEPDGGTHEIVRMAPSLGGAVVGVSVLVDAAGNDTYQSRAYTRLSVFQDDRRPGEAIASTYGGIQGGGVFGGVGLLVDLGGSDDYTARVENIADESDGGTVTPTSFAAGVGQGGGWFGGLGALLDLGDGDDAFDFELVVDADGHTKGEHAFAAAQGASRSGAGVFIDLTGDATVRADAIVAQGAAWSTYETQPFEDRHPTNNVRAQRIPFVSSLPSIGLLFGSTGDSSYTGTSYAQGAAGGATGDGTVADTAPWAFFSQDTDRPLNYRGNPETFYAPAVGVLLDLGGNDDYTAHPSTGGDVAAQGAAVLGAGALLMDLEGDDRYDAVGMDLAQGSGWLGQGFLIDQFGHDNYAADRRAQGFATDDPATVLDARLCAAQAHHVAQTKGTEVYCPEETGTAALYHPDNLQYKEGTIQAVGEVHSTIPTMGVLLDRHGIDRYEAESLSQGVAVGVLQRAAATGVCSVDYLYVEQTGERVPLPPYLRTCSKDYPDSDPDPTKDTWADPDTAPTPTHTFVLGLLMDTGNLDTYVYGDEAAKETVSVQEGGAYLGNNWTWSQTYVDDRVVGDADLPQDNVRDREEGTEDAATTALDGAGAGDTQDAAETAIDEPVLPDPIAGQALPREGQPVRGLGIDDGTVDTALGLVFSEVLAGQGVAELSLGVFEDVGESVPAKNSEGVLYARIEGAFPPGLELDRIDLLANGILLERLDAIPEDLLEWDTTEREGIILTYPDGTYTVQASAVFDLGHYGPVSIESTPVLVGVNNPPLLTVLPEADQAVSPPQGDEITYRFTITPDLGFPEGEGPEEPGDEPGGYLNVTLHNLDTGAEHTLVADEYRMAGTSTLPFAGDCGADPCPDGAYELRVEAVDSLGNGRSVTRGLLIDGSAPRSSINLPQYAGARDYADGSALRVPFHFDDDASGADTVSGVAVVNIFRLATDGTVTYVGGNTVGEVFTSDNILSGQPARFLSVAVDALGNSESPCLTGEAKPCYRAKLAAAQAGTLAPGSGPDVETIVDFTAPSIPQLVASHATVAPGRTPVVYTAVVQEYDTHLTSVSISFDGGDPIEMDEIQPSVFEYADWNLVNGDVPADEVPYVYTVLAFDAAGNAAREFSEGILDRVPPTIDVRNSTYADSEGTPRVAAGPGAEVRVRAMVRDADLGDNVTVDLSPVHPDLGVEFCDSDDTTLDPNDWYCQTFLPLDVQDGVYWVSLNATDVAGNAASALARIVVSNDAVVISDVRTTAVDSNFVEISWTTLQESSSRVYYGGTSELGRATTRDLDYTTEHTVRVDGLSPASTYYFVVASENRAGGETRADTVLPVETTSAIRLSFPESLTGTVLTGDVEIPVDVEVLLEGNPVTATLFSERPDGLGGRQRIAQVDSEPGRILLPLETASLGDGGVVLVVEVNRGTDLARIETGTVIVDNTAPTLIPVRPLPGFAVLASEPRFELRVFDAVDAAPVEADALRLFLDGVAVVPTSLDLETSGVSRALEFTLPAVAVGEHELTVTLPDAAGNAAPPLELVFEAADVAADSDARVDYGDHTAGAPGHPVTFVYDAVTNVEAVSVDLAPLASGFIDLERTPSWEAPWVVPADAASGTYLLDALVTETGGEPERIDGAFALTVDADVPIITTLVEAHGPCCAVVNLTANEPVSVRVLLDGLVVAHNDVPALVHGLALSGLPDGDRVDLDVEATDGAGNRVVVERALLMPADVEAPSAVADLTARVLVGDVHLSWTPSTDDGAVTAYTVTRGGATWTVADTAFRDSTAPGDEALTYEVRAVDAAGNLGPAETVDVTVPARLEVLDARFEPDVGDTTTPFQVIVELRHNLADAPEVTLDVDGRTLDFHAVDDASCLTGCTYATETLLPATRVGAAAMDLHVGVGDEHVERSVPPGAVTVVQAMEDAESPAPLVLIPLLAALYVARRWRK